MLLGIDDRRTFGERRAYCTWCYFGYRLLIGIIDGTVVGRRDTRDMRLYDTLTSQ